MIRVSQLKLPVEHSEEQFCQKIEKSLKIKKDQIKKLQIVKKSIDARKKPDVSIVYSVDVWVDNEEKILKHSGNKNAVCVKEKKYKVPEHGTERFNHRPVVIGAGPAGLFCAYLLAREGYRPLVFERGKKVGERTEDVLHFWKTGVLNPASNVQFGEGGAGAFSDGKLNTGTKDLRHRWILEQLVSCGAPESILIDARPHVGTDKLHIALKNLRQRLLDLGADIRFGHRLEGIEAPEGELAALVVSGPEGSYRLPARQLILALGHSARDTVEMLYDRGLSMEAKPFAAGVRIEHLQSHIDAVQYKEYAGHPALPVSTYKLSCHLPGGRSVFSFCVCPGGEVVAAASERERTVTNGMSEYARDGENINGGLLVNVTPEDFGSGHPLAGIAFQRRLEGAAYRLGGGYTAPCQRVEDFLLRRPSTGCGSVRPSFRPGVRYADLHECLPEFITQALEQALPILDKKLPGFAHGDALLTAVESRSSAPVRIPRDENYESNIRGVFPCGEGAGYAGGILSAAADGMRCAEKILAKNL